MPRHEELTPSSDRRRAPSAEEVALEGRLHPAVSAVLAELPARQREVLLLRVVAGLDVADVAEILGRSDGAVKQLQHRALTALRAQLAPEPEAATVTRLALPPMAGTT